MFKKNSNAISVGFVELNILAVEWAYEIIQSSKQVREQRRGEGALVTGDRVDRDSESS